jgi:dipeptidyl aminopeptidase/acylaminoacyl peptidase
LKSFRGQSKLSNFKWIPKTNKYSFTIASKKKTTIWISDIKTGMSVSLKTGIKNFSSYQWSPDGSYILYSISDKSDSTKHGIKKLKGMPDHWPQYRHKKSWYRLSYPSGVSKQIIGNNSQMGILDISPNGQNILFYDLIYDYQDRPFSKLTMYLLDIKTMQADSIWAGRWLNSAKFSPDGEKLLCQGGPSLFGGIGVNLPEDMIPNEADVQIYIYDLTTGKVKAISRDFNSKIEGSAWHQDGIFVIGEDMDYQHLYHYDVKSGKYLKISSGIDVVSRMSFADQASIALISGTSTSHPARIAVVDLEKKSGKILFDPTKDFLRNTKFGEVKKWTFDSKFNFTVDGRVYYPPGFDSNKKYPCIVYYYGGTSPVSRSYGGRYPFNYYTANGYVVYVINPAGATGYGQKHSALHVNDWGKITGEQIIEGTNKFLKAHPFVDSDRVGCMGASYGGFMTMYLVSQTDIFSAAISHAGISSLSSYWGEGYWGYLYSSTATAGSYPWNRKDIYVDRSPLFLADSINTPLLLLHGADDTNVPPGESRQLYTALKILNKPVELLEISGQNHWIMQYDKRKRWTKTIIAWFDYWLKAEPEWWDHLYPEE